QIMAVLAWWTSLAELREADGHSARFSEIKRNALTRNRASAAGVPVEQDRTPRRSHCGLPQNVPGLLPDRHRRRSSNGWNFGSGNPLWFPDRLQWLNLAT